MKILVAETSTPQGSVSLITESAVSERVWEKESSHSEIITLEATSLLKENSTSISELTGLAVGCGPGSFTGIRVAINFIKTLGYIQHLPVLPVCSLELLALQAIEENKSVIAFQPAFRNLVYVAKYSKDSKNYFKTDLPPRAMTWDDLVLLSSSDSLMIGEVVSNQNLPQTFIEKVTRHKSFSKRPKSSYLENLLRHESVKSRFLPWNQVVPLYIRASEAEEKALQGVIKPL